MTSTNRPPETPTWPHDHIIHAWWVIPGRLLAGEYPSSLDPEAATRKRRALLEAGVDSFVDLTEASESTWGGQPLTPYDDLMTAEAQGYDLNVGHARFEIPDNDVIDDAGYDEILDHIRSELDGGKVVYVHCWGGKGRTGTVVGAWLIEQEGLNYTESLRRMEELRRGTKKAYESVPQTPVQHAVLRQRAQPEGRMTDG